MPSLTSQQAAAVKAQGNVLLMAGAGTGKTSTLVARCLYWLFEAQRRTSLDRVLMVTFTDAAATEMRERIRQALWERSQQEQEREQAQLQLALLDTAHIRTLHSFNLELVRRHFLELKLDPQASVLDPTQARLLQEEVLEALWDRHLAAASAQTGARAWLKTLGTDGERRVRDWLLDLHRRWRILPDPKQWMEQQLGLLGSPEPQDWEQKLPAAFTSWAQEWREFLKCLNKEHYAGEAKIKEETIKYAQEFAALVPEQLDSLQSVIECLQGIVARNTTENWPSRQATAGREPIKKFLQEAQQFLGYLKGDSGSPLDEDWHIVRPWLKTFLELVREFEEGYAQAKRQRGALDFNDFEQFALRLLYEPGGDPSAIAREWRERFDVVLVDEYQDINPAQDAIIRALSREGERANRFLVGDVKQSIYRFRGADPKIFQDYAHQWARLPHSQVLHLNENFRSHEGILVYVNHFFTGLMVRQVGGVEYDKAAHLQFGAAAERSQFSRQNDGKDSRRVELHLILPGQPAEASNAAQPEENAQDSAAENEEASAPVDADELKIEARLVARKLLELKGRHRVWRRQEKQFVPADWRDMVILLRAPRGRAEAFVQECQRAGIPLRAELQNFLESQEVQDLVNLLRLLDNPRQDLPLVAVLRSPLVGLKLDDLARIRLASQKSCLWIALQRWLEADGAADGEDSPARRVKQFVEQYQRWRELARRGALVTCLETILTETHYDVWCQTQPEGAQRHANVQHLLHVARHFDNLQRQGLHRFLQYLESYAELDLRLESPQAVAENCVRLMSIHQSKGLEFPIVVLAQLGMRFNFTQEEIMWDEELGLCPRVHPPGRPAYPSLLRRLAQHRQRMEMMGEELRLLYVAMTRACDLLVLTGTASPAQMKRWRQQAALPASARAVANAQSALEWVGRWWLANLPEDDRKKPEISNGCNGLVRWQIHRAEDLATWKPPAADQGPPPEKEAARGQADIWVGHWKSLREWKYRAHAATLEPAKTHVSALRHRAMLEAEGPAEAQVLPQAYPHLFGQGKWSDQKRGMQAGALHHLFLEQLDLGSEPSLEHFQAQAQLMVQQGLLAPAEAGQLQLERLLAFWTSELGVQIRAHRAHVHREIPFTARFTAADLQAAGLATPGKLGEEEFVVVQGVADLMVLLENELWVLDYKTDHITMEKVAERAEFYAPQVRLYGLALSRIYHRPVVRLYLHFLVPGVTSTVVPIAQAGTE
ncbi:helicase-exonuclease AddAB subunit AddA [Fontisphaera persica]|uniref:helicase-exonuclease AddAB subunit AddA n=1 Tax=Fontisphaera persica TaxID=2974023 RepID=UPI0024BF6589|nr:helicase-exonuclease AddAB subunit AddA [Fontisphaera persica]WCJ59274.1 helicase-exonuclease AddAB subunit AddA [Fontisphaera persica]